MDENDHVGAKSMEAGRVGIGRTLILFSSLATACLVFIFSNRGVREIRSVASVDDRLMPHVDSSPEDWPCWRGTNQTNVALSSLPPLNWSISDNILWRAAVPGRGHSSPCIWNDRIFLTTSDAELQSISLLSYDRGTGRLLWQTEIHRGGLAEIHNKNSHASSSPACDGQHVYIASEVDSAIWVSAVDFAGCLVWQTKSGPYSSEWGYGSSPAIYKSLVIVAGDNRGQAVDRIVGTSWLTGLERASGKINWRVKRVEGDSFGSPLVATVADHDQLLLAGKESVNSYDPATGDLFWKCRWGIKRTANTVAFDDQHVYASGRHPQGEILSIRADGSGDVTETHISWREKKSACDVPSPCFYEGHLYSVSDDGVLTCLNAGDGKTVWKKRLGGNFSSSPLIAGRHIFCCNEDGQTFVVDLDRRGEVVAENKLDDAILASPVISGDRIYLRTLSTLFCLSAQSVRPVAEKPIDSDQHL